MPLPFKTPRNRATLSAPRSERAGAGFIVVGPTKNRSLYHRYTLLLDTYDPRSAIHTAIEVARHAQDLLGHTLAAVRLDSGDLLGDSLYVREQLERAGLADVRIVASGDLDEWKILALLQAGATLDAFGVGTALGAGTGSVEQGMPGGALGAAYKAVWYVNEQGGASPMIKVAGAKSTWPGKKESYRHPAWEEDIIQLAHEPPPEIGRASCRERV